jgi:hypothetical protein
MRQITKSFASWAIATAVVSASFSAHPPAQAQSCRHAGASQERSGSKLTLGSQVDGDLVTICLNKKLIKSLTQTTAPKPAPKPTPKVLSKITTKKAVRSAPTPRTSKPAVRTKTRAQASSSTAVFKAMKPNSWVSPTGALKPGQSATFQVEFRQRFGKATLFGNSVVVRFKPESVSWVFGDGAAAETITASHDYLQSGNFLALAHVKYRVDYRLASGAWLKDPDPIVLASVPLNISVAANLEQQPSGNTVLITPP